MKRYLKKIKQNDSEKIRLILVVVIIVCIVRICMYGHDLVKLLSQSMECVVSGDTSRNGLQKLSELSEVTYFTLYKEDQFSVTVRQHDFSFPVKYVSKEYMRDRYNVSNGSAMTVYYANDKAVKELAEYCSIENGQVRITADSDIKIFAESSLPDEEAALYAVYDFGDESTGNKSTGSDKTSGTADDSAGKMDTGGDSYNILIYIDKQNIDGRTMDRISAAGYTPVDRTAIDKVTDKEKLIIIRMKYLSLIILTAAAGCMWRKCKYSEYT